MSSCYVNNCFMQTTFIRSIKLNDKEDWQKLYKGYAEFYQVEMTQTILNTVWGWLNDEQHELNGLVCEFEERIVAFAHYRRMPSPLRGKDIGFLDDLFVSPEFRGLKIGEQLILKLKTISSAKGCIRFPFSPPFSSDLSFALDSVSDGRYQHEPEIIHFKISHLC